MGALKGKLVERTGIGTASEAQGAIRLIATDMDGTLLDPQGNPPAEFEGWVCAHPEVKVAIASGRQMQTLWHQFANVQDRLVFISDNGALVVCGGETLQVKDIEAAKAKVCLEVFEGIPGAVPILCGVRTAYTRDDVGADVRAAIEQYYLSLSYVSDFDGAFATDDIIKIAVFFSNGPVPRDEPWKAMIPDGLKALVTSMYWVDVADEAVNKGQAMRAIQERLSISPEECMAFGDFLNDIDLLEACGESYCMDNGCDEVKAVAKHLAPSNADNGVMRVLEEAFA